MGQWGWLVLWGRNGRMMLWMEAGCWVCAGGCMAWLCRTAISSPPSMGDISWGTKSPESALEESAGLSHAALQTLLSASSQQCGWNNWDYRGCISLQRHRPLLEHRGISIPKSNCVSMKAAAPAEVLHRFQRCMSEPQTFQLPISRAADPQETAVAPHWDVGAHISKRLLRTKPLQGYSILQIFIPPELFCCFHQCLHQHHIPLLSPALSTDTERGIAEALLLLGPPCAAESCPQGTPLFLLLRKMRHIRSGFRYDADTPK